MFIKKLPQFVKYGLYGTFVIGGSVAAAITIPDSDSSAIYRFLRTAYTAVDIGRTYNDLLYSKKIDVNSPEYQILKHQAHEIGAQKLLDLCKANKGVYIKVGQHIGALDYLLPSEYVKKMRILHKDAPKNSVELLYKVLREDLKVEPETLFDQFDPEPLGTASLAQVHRANLKDGTEVAVKVQHYFVKQNMHLDIKWIEFIVRGMSVVFPEFQMQWLIDETKKNITKELDFIQEGHNAEKFASMFSHYKWLKVPKIYWDYCTDRVLVMEYVTGGQVNDLKYIDENKIDRLDLCKKLGDLYSHMIFITGFVHSDPHPGNILVNKAPNDKEVTIWLLDHGLYAQLTDDFRYNYSKLWLSIIDGNKEDMKFFCQALGIRKELFGIFACMVTGRSWDAIMKGIGKTKPSKVEKRSFQEEIPDNLSFITECLEHVDRQALLVLKTNDLIRSIEYTLGMHDRMSGFIVMSQCCVQSVYDNDYKNANSFFKRSLLNLKFSWTLIMLYLYSVYLSVYAKFNM